MCSVAKSVKLPTVPDSPPPPEETAQTFQSVREQAEKNKSKKKKNYDPLRVQNRSPLALDSEGKSYGLNIP